VWERRVLWLKQARGAQAGAAGAGASALEAEAVRSHANVWHEGYFAPHAPSPRCFILFKGTAYLTIYKHHS